MLDPQRCAGVALGVEVHYEYPQATERQRRGEVHRRRRLAHPTLLVGHDQDAGFGRGREGGIGRRFT